MGAKYKKNFLTNVIFRIDFPPLENYTVDKLKEFQRLIKNEFPILEENSKTITDKNHEKIQVLRWTFFNKTKKKAVLFEKDNIVVECSGEYNSFDGFSKLIRLTIKSLFDIFPQSIVTKRIGLRYINQIELDDKDFFNWDGLINNSLVPPKSTVFEKDKLTRCASLVEINYDDYRILFQFGLANSTYPSIFTKKEFVLDYDCFNFESCDKPEDIVSAAKKFNEAITNLFEKSIEQKLRTIMGEIKNDQV